MSELHFLRARQKDSTEPFCDPLADIKVIVKQFIVDIPYILKEQGFQEDDLDWIKATLKVYITRLEEDPAPMWEQLDDFVRAYSKYPARLRAALEKAFLLYILLVFSMFDRRDNKADKDSGIAINVSAVAALFSTLVEKDKLQKYLSPLIEDVPEKVLEDAEAICIEDNDKTIRNLKTLVASLVGANQKDSWPVIAEAVDNHSGLTGEAEVAQALAYPTYKNPYFEVTQKED